MQIMLQLMNFECWVWAAGISKTGGLKFLNSLLIQLMYGLLKQFSWALFRVSTAISKVLMIDGHQKRSSGVFKLGFSAWVI